MKKFSKILSVILSLLLVGGVFRLPVQAAPAQTPVAQFYGIGDGLKATLTFNYNTMQIEAVIGDPWETHDYFPGEYFGVSVYDANRKLVINASQTGVTNAENFVNSLNGLTFGINYVVQIRHQEASTRLFLNGGFSPSTQTTTSEYYQVTDSGMVKINVNSYGPGIDAPSQMIYVGDSFDPLAAVKAYDIVDGDISHSVRVTGNTVNTSTPGQYSVFYSVTDSNGRSASAAAGVTVLPLPTLSVSSGSVYAGDTLQLGVEYTPAEATISYRALNPDIAVMNGPATVLGLRKGTAQFEIKLTSSDGVKVITQTATVEVKELPEVHVGNVEFYVGDYQYASIIYVPNDATITYSSANPEIATITPESRITGVSPGITQMTATATTADGVKTASTNFEVAVLALPSVSIPEQTIYLDETIPISYRYSPDTATATYSSDDESILTIDDNGKMTPHALGQTRVTVIVKTIDGKKTASSSTTVTVLPLPTVSVSEQTLYAGETLPVIPQYTPEDATLSYATGDPSIATVDGNGNLVGQKGGTTTLEVIATTADGRKTASQTVKVTVLAQPVVSTLDMTVYVNDTVKLVAQRSPANGPLTFVSADPNIASVDNGYVTGKSPGVTTVTIRNTTVDGKYYAEAVATITVLALPTIDTNNQSVYVGDTSQTELTVAPDDATITYAIENSAIATVDASGVVNGVSPGATNLTVTAKTADGQKVASKTVVVTVLALPEVAADALSVYAGDTAALTVRTAPDDVVLSYQSDDIKIATVNGNGEVSGIAAGTANITVRAVTADGLKSTETTVVVTVLALPTIQASDKYLYAGDSVHAEAVVTPADATVSYVMLDSDIATVDNAGNITGVSAGKTVLRITATTADNEKTVVEDIPVTIYALPEIIINDFTIYQNRTEPLLYLATPATATKTFASADDSIAAIDQYGNVTGWLTGTTTITVTVTTADGQKTTSKTVTVTVLAQPQITADEQHVYVGDTKALEYIVSPADATVTYEVENEELATIDANGNITGLNSGTTAVKIRAVTADGRESTEITVALNVLALPWLDAQLDTIYVGDSMQTAVQIKPDNGVVTYAIADETVATVDENGLVQGVAAGETVMVVTLTTADGEKTEQRTVPVTVLAQPGLSVDAMQLYVGDNANAAVDFSPATAVLSYAVAEPEVAEVQANGVVVAKSVGTTTLTVTLTTADGRKTVIATNTIQVLPLPELAVSDTTVYLDDAMNMAVTFSPDDATLTYTSADTSVADIDDAGLITPKKAGTSEITVMLTTSDGKKVLTETAMLTVLPLPTVSIADIEIYSDDTATLNPQFVPSDAVVTYSSSEPAVATVNSAGEVQGVAAGSTVITVTMTTADGRKTVSAQSTVTVLPLPDIQTNDQSLYVGDTVAIEVTAGQSGFTYAYSSSDEAVVTVDNAGNMTGVAAGTATITIVATTADGQKSTTTTMTVTVLALPTVQAENVVVYAGDYQTASAVFTPADAKLQWQVEDEAIATIDDNGRVLGVTAGETNLTATVTTADGQKTVSHTVVITVLALPMLEVSERYLYVGDVQATDMQYSPDDATITYQIADTNIATIDGNNNIVGVAAGETELTVRVVTADGKKSITKKTTVTVYGLPTVEANSKTIYAGDSASLDAQYTPASAAVTYKSNNERVVTVDEDGTITGVSGGETTITITVTTADEQKNSTIDVSITVLALPELTLEPITLYVDDSQAANPVYQPDDAVLTYSTANPTIATVDASGAVSGLVPGTTELIVTLVTADHQKTILAKTEITVLALPTITVADQILYFGDTKAIDAQYAPADGSISYTIADTSVASVDAAGTITARRPGTTTLTVKVTTADKAKTTETTVSLRVLPLPEMLFPVSAPTLYAGDSMHFLVDYIPTDASVSYQIDDQTIATVDNQGNIQGLAAGTATLTVQITTKDGEKSATKTAQVTVLPLPTITADPVSVYVANTAVAPTTYSPADAKLVYRVDDAAIAEIDDSGVVSGLTPGATEYSVTETTADGLKTATAGNTITVLALPQVTTTDQVLYIDESKTIVPEFSPADASVSYQVDDEQIATISADGVINAKKVGTTTYRITVTTKDGLQTAVTEAKMTILALPTVAITNTAELATIYQNDSAQLQVQTTPDANVLTYNVADPTILSVSDTGVIQGLAVGTTKVTVTATTEDGQRTATTEITISVLALPQLNVDALTTYVGDQTPLSMTYQPNDAAITYKSNDEKIATIDGFGTVTAMAAGTTEITVTLTTADGRKTIEQTITVTVQALPTIDFQDQSIYIDDNSHVVTLAKTPENAGIKYTVADPTILTIDGNGQIHPLQVGKTAVQVLVTTADNKKSVEAEAIIEVLPLPEVQASDYVLYSGDSIPFITTYKPNDATLSYTVADTSIATISDDGTITGEGAGVTEATVTVTTADGLRTAAKTVKITVYPLPSVVIGNQYTYVGNEKQLQMSYQPADATLSYTIADPAIAEVSPEGVLVGVATGTTQLTVTLTTADNMKTVTKTVDVNVLPLPSIKAGDVIVYTGDTQALELEYSPKDATISYQVADQSIATIDAKGTVSGKKAGTTDVTITLTTSDGEQVSETTVTITVLPLPTIQADDLAVAVGEIKNLAATYQPEDAIVEYLSADSNIAYVYNDETGHTSGDVFGVKAGTTTVTITVRTVDGLKYAETTVTITVSGDGTATAPNSPADLDGKTIIFGLPVTGQNDTIGIIGIGLIISGASMGLLVRKRRKKIQSR